MERTRMLRFIVGLQIVVGSLMLVCAAHAQEPWPNKPVRILVGFPAGTSTDIIARVYGQRLSEQFKRPFVIENRPGLGGNLAAQAASKAPADGYTFLMATVANTISASVYKNLGYDFEQDFTPVARLASAANVLVVGPGLPVSSVRELIATAKTQPGRLFFGSAGVGTAPHLSGELFNLMAGTKIVHVPYKGNAQGLVDLADGRLSLIFAPAPTLAAFIKDQRVKALAVTSAKRSSFLPDLPTLAESGLPGFDTSLWYGLVAYKGTPIDAIRAIGEAAIRASELPEVRAQLAHNGAEPLPANADEFNRFIKDDVRKWAKVVEFAQVKPE
jgi:tripartite-type tricarboxylate transporter receptor subunit TctC